MSTLSAKEYKCFEDIKRIRPDGSEYWAARELAPVLDYAKWENFYKVIKRAMIACENSGRSTSECFPEVRKTSPMPNGGVKDILDYELSRYACYLIVQNGDPRKEVIALGQTYFAIQTGRRLQTALISWMRIVAGLWFAVISSSGISFWQRPRETQALSRRKNLQSFRMPDIWACMAE